MGDLADMILTRHLSEMVFAVQSMYFAYKSCGWTLAWYKLGKDRRQMEKKTTIWEYHSAELSWRSATYLYKQ